MISQYGIYAHIFHAVKHHLVAVNLTLYPIVRGIRIAAGKIADVEAVTFERHLHQCSVTVVLVITERNHIVRDSGRS